MRTLKDSIPVTKLFLTVKNVYTSWADEHIGSYGSYHDLMESNPFILL